MIELKTLKDIEGVGVGHEHLILRDTLRQEAIKWIKDIDKDWNSTRSGRHYRCSEYFEGQINFLKHFFNITEEELVQ